MDAVSVFLAQWCLNYSTVCFTINNNFWAVFEDQKDSLIIRLNWCDVSSVGAKEEEEHKELVVASYDGTVLWVPPVKYKSSCEVDENTFLQYLRSYKITCFFILLFSRY